MSTLPRTLVAGIGSDHGDDRVGWDVAEQLQREYSDRSDILIRRAQVPLDVIDWLDDILELHICDAILPIVEDLATASQQLIRQFNWVNGDLVERTESENKCPAVFICPERVSGTHGFSLPDVLRLADVTGRLPAAVTVWGIPVRYIETAGELSSGARVAVKMTVNLITDVLGRPEPVADSNEVDFPCTKNH